MNYDLSYRIKALTFGLLSPEQIRKIGTIEITSPDTYDEEGSPIEGGVLDPRLGVIDPTQVCKTCGNRIDRCPGHFGRIELVRPVLHVGFVREIRDILNSTCANCNRILLPEDVLKEYLEKMNKYIKIHGEISQKIIREVITKASKVQKCPHCGKKAAKVKVEYVYRFYVEHPNKRRIWPQEIRERLEGIPDDDVLLLGFHPGRSRPENAVLTVILVPPLSIRPSVTLETGEKSEDDLTHKLADIVRVNRKLESLLGSGSPSVLVEETWDLLQYHVATLYDNTISGLPPATQHGKRPIKAIFDRWSGKDGRFRNNLIGKRVDFSSRTVITPDPMIDIGEVGVPVEIAKVLTLPEHVNEYNIEELKERVKNGPEYPGANYVIRPNGEKVKLTLLADRQAIADELDYNYVVERHLQDGDSVIFNRHPSLHRLSILKHRVKVLPYGTFRLNPAVCTPYNADFDGDEMNVHAPQSLQARIEGDELLAVEKNLVSPRIGGAIIGGSEDYITAAYLMTSEKTKLTKKDASRILVWGGIYKLPEPDEDGLWSGKKIFSMFLPKGIEFRGKASSCRGCEKCLEENCPYDAYVVVKDGKLIKGALDTNTIGVLVKAKTSLLDTIIRDKGEEAAADFISRYFKALSGYIRLRGTTMSLSDVELPPEALKEVEEVIEKGKKDVMELIERAKKGKLEAIPGMTKRETLERLIMDVLQKTRGKHEEIVKRYLNPDSDPYIMARTKARGSILNLTQMSASLGQQAIRGKRVTTGFKGRTLSCFVPGEDEVFSKGYVKNSYVKGLTPAEFLFHAMAGRDSLVDKGLRTAESGYTYRKLANALKDCMVDYDFTVRDSEDNIIQFKFGDDGIDPAKYFHGEYTNFRKIAEESVKKAGEEQPLNPEDIEDKISKAGLPITLAKHLIELKAGPKAVQSAINEGLRVKERCMVQPLHPVGIIAAESVAEPATQMTLRTFHTPGVAELNITLGLPRLIELFDARRKQKTPRMTVYLKPKIAKSKEEAEKIVRNMVEIKVGDLAKMVLTDYYEREITIILDKSRVKKADVKAEDIAKLLNKLGKVSVENGEIKVKLQKEGFIRQLRDLRRKILDTHVKGIKGIKKARVRFKDGEYIIETEGVNLQKVFEIDGVDTTKTTCNDIYEVRKVLGIEAARNLLIEEVLGVLEGQGLEVDRRHVSLIADIMCFTGEIRQVGRYGVLRDKKDILARAAFETTKKVILDASRQGVRTELKSPLDAVIVGKPPRIGTGGVNIYWYVGEIESGAG
uniref:DNA-directed RNA polymerase subunit n=1 Tax=uncultured korarchaeote TaxID=161241 RepID=A0A1L2JMQ2_9CREN|nr:DNA-directed RNA polymerase, beta' subunit/160 kD subunit [uncultured korarchaeote]